ncbi:hypothetical protein U6B65_14810 (plasmid) [Oscillospiraceae bacterium MB08-C2-2]|nr:hypothetical protein U6B65_14810 [Oscillospiraceae bacterium MB08-C2-2]
MDLNKQDINMLNNVYQNAEMGIKGTQLLVEKSDDPRFSQTLHRFLGEYAQLKEQAATLLLEQGEQPRDSNLMESTGLWMGVQFNTLIDKTSSHMAEMLIQGSAMGIVDNTKTLNTHQDISPQAKKVAENLIRIEQDNIKAMKQYLN